MENNERKKKRKNHNSNLNIRLSKKIYDDFAKCCECNSISISEQIRFFVLTYINENKEFLKERGER